MKIIELVRRVFHEEVTAYTNVIQLSKRNYEAVIEQDDQLSAEEQAKFKSETFFRHPKATNLILSVHPRLNDMQIQVIRDKIINLSEDIVKSDDFYSKVAGTTNNTETPAAQPANPTDPKKAN